MRILLDECMPSSDRARACRVGARRRLAAGLGLYINFRSLTPSNRLLHEA